MPDAIWVDQESELTALAVALESQAWIGLDTEFLRERTFFPKLCLLQLSVQGRIWCVDTLRGSGLESLVPALTQAATRKVIHAARQDLEAFYLTTKRVISPVFDTQIAAACVGLKPQIGYAELVKTLLDVSLTKGQTRTDWSKRPLSRAQLDYAADDVLYLGEIASSLQSRLRELGREHWVLEDCLGLEDPKLYEPDPEQAGLRLRGLAQLAPAARARAKVVAAWREQLARGRDLPRSWIVSDAAIFEIAHANPVTREALGALPSIPPTLNSNFAATLLEALHGASQAQLTDLEPGKDARPTAEQKTLIERLAKTVQQRAAELKLSAETLAPRGELKALAMGQRQVHSLSGWRRQEIGELLLAQLD